MPRYIDADNLIADFESVGGELDVDGIKYIINTYHKPADVAPVVRGEWKKDGEYPWLLNCSGCGYSTECGTKYCPNCGAKMESEGGT